MIDTLEGLISSTSIEEAWDWHTRKMADYGFDRLLYGFTRFRTAHSFGNPQDLLILSNHDPAYVERFMDGGLYFHAPMVRWAAENVGACSWSWMEKNAGALSPSEMKVVEFNRKMGVTAGYSISFRDSSVRAKGAIALTGRKDMSQAEVDEIWKDKGREITVINNVLHLMVTSLPQPTGPRGLTKRQREVLEWVGDGKTMQDIALLMSLTPATVEKHLRLARESLEVETTAQAVLKASVNKQLFVLEV